MEALYRPEESRKEDSEEYKDPTEIFQQHKQKQSYIGSKGFECTCWKFYNSIIGPVRPIIERHGKIKERNMGMDLIISPGSTILG